jgi:hypothetical protein
MVNKPSTQQTRIAALAHRDGRSVVATNEKLGKGARAGLKNIATGYADGRQTRLSTCISHAQFPSILCGTRASARIRGEIHGCQPALSQSKNDFQAAGL